MKSVLKLIMRLRKRAKHINMLRTLDKVIVVWVIIPCFLRITVQILSTDLKTLETALDEENELYQTWFTEKSTHPFRLICDLGILVVIMLFATLILRTWLHVSARTPISDLILDVILISLAMMIYLVSFRSNEM